MSAPSATRLVTDADVAPCAPSQVREHDLLAVHRHGDGTWETREVLRTCDGGNDPAWNCPRTRIWMDAVPGEDDQFHQPEVLSMLIVTTPAVRPVGAR